MDWLTSLALAGAAFLAGSILPFASEAALIAAILQSPQAVWGYVAVVSVANTAGAAVNWWLGGQLNRFQDKRWFPASPQGLARARGWYQKFGIYSLLLSWLPVVGDPLTVIAGWMRVPILQFLIFVGVAKTARYAIVAWTINLQTM